MGDVTQFAMPTTGVLCEYIRDLAEHCAVSVVDTHEPHCHYNRGNGQQIPQSLLHSHIGGMTTSDEPNTQELRCVCDVYHRGMARTNIDLDEEAVKRVMERYGFSTMREAVNYALNRLAPRKATVAEALAAQGIGWDEDLEQMRGQK